jgi:hypothetical protein
MLIAERGVIGRVEVMATDERPNCSQIARQADEWPPGGTAPLSAIAARNGPSAPSPLAPEMAMLESCGSWDFELTCAQSRREMQEGVF